MSDRQLPLEPVSVLVNTLNAAATLDLALRSVRSWATEVIVVDQRSSDETLQIAERHNARIFVIEPTGYVEPARQYALDRMEQPWGLIVDADEVVPRPLSQWITSESPRREADVWRVPRRNFFWGGSVDSAGWGPDDDAQLRFFKRGALRASEVIHRPPPVSEDGRTKSLPYDGSNALIHFNYDTVSDFLLRLDRYTTVEAGTRMLERGIATRSRSLLRASNVIRKRYLRQRGRSGGWRGFYLSFFMAFYSLAVDAKVRELAEVEQFGAARQRHRHIAEKFIAEYGVES